MNFNDNDMNQSKQSIKKLEKEEKKQFQGKVLSANNSLKATREKLQLTICSCRQREYVEIVWRALKRLELH